MNDGPVDTKLEPMPPEVEELLDRERETAVAPPVGAQRDVFASVMATMAASLTSAEDAPDAGAASSPAVPSAGSGAGSTAASAAQASLAGRIATSIALITFGAAAGAGGHALYASQTTPAPAPIVQIVHVPVPAPTPAPASAPPAAPEENSPSVAAPAPAPDPGPTSAPAPAPARTPPEKRAADRGSDTSLAAERAIVEVARTALLRGQADGAIAELEKHARLYPRGQLSEEREALLVQALVSAGRNDEARSLGRRFIQRHPKSMLLPLVQAVLESIP